MEFKFDDTRLSYWHKNQIGRIEFFCFVFPDFANFLPCWLAQFCWYHQTWIPNNLGFIVSDLVYIISIPQTNTCLHTYHIQVRKWRNEARRSHKLLSNFSAVDSRTKNPFGYPSKKINMIQLSTGDFFQLLYSLK